MTKPKKNLMGRTSGLGRLLAVLAFGVASASAAHARAAVVISEIMYHPPSDLEIHDFIELHNNGAAAVNLQNWCIDGIGFCFGAGARIPAGGYIVVARDSAGFLALYGFSPDFVYAGTLSNSGELISLKDATTAVVDAVQYSDIGLWPTRADGEGPSLERIDLSLDGNTPRNWAASIAPAMHTARAANSVASSGLPPWITEVTHTADIAAGVPVLVTARVEDATTVELTYRIDFDAPVTGPMFDDGAHGDGAAADGIYGVEIPGQAVNTLIRYQLNATGPTGAMRHPRIDDTINYLGAMVPDPSLETQLPVFHWFMDPADYADAIAHKLTDETESAILVYDGVVYDNLQVRVRGQTARTWPKNHWKFSFPQGHDFYAPGLIAIPVDQFNFQCNYSDKSYVREILSYESFRDAGHASNQVFHVRLHQNGQFYGLYNWLESMDDDYIARNGLDENAAWYKSDDDFRWRPLASLPSEYQKEQRTYEGYEDLSEFINGVNILTGTARRNFIYDNVNIPDVINYIAAECIVHNNDHPAKNYFLYRDTEGTRRWTMQTWDMDLTFGRNFGAGGGVLSDGIWADDDAPHPTNPLVSPSHPLFGDSNHRKWDDLWNRLIHYCHDDPQIRQMYFRRLRTLADKLLADGRYEARIDELVSRIGPEAVLDVAKWGQYGTPQSLETAVNILKNDYLAVRRIHLLTTHRVPGEIPEAQSTHPKIVINEIMYHAATSADHEFIELYNPSLTEAVDISGWRLDGVALNFPAGSVVLPNDFLLVVRNDVEFRASYGTGKFVAADYTGNLDDSGELLRLRHPDGTIIDTVKFESAAPWPTTPHGMGPSLELIDPTSDNSRVASWAPSAASGGTPGLPNSTLGAAPPIPNLYVNEVLLVNTSDFRDENGDAHPWIEIYNAGDSTVELGGMHLTDNYSQTTKWQIPSDTSLCAGQYMIFWADGETSQGPRHTNFMISSTSATVALCTSTGVVIDYLNTGNVPSGLSVGRLPDGESRTYELVNNTPGAANDGDSSPVILNEYNGVRSTSFIKDGAADIYWGRVLGNGGDWFELVVTRDHIDMRGWELALVDNGAPVTLTLTEDPIWADMRVGTIITVSEELPDDVSFNPAAGDWWINVRASSAGTGTYISATNFDVSHQNTQLTIKNALGEIVFGPAGEGVEPVSGIGNDEIFKLEEDPGAHIHPRSDYNDGSTSTFGAPNRFAANTIEQDFVPLRETIQFCSVPGECDDGDPCTIDDCVSGECVHSPVSPCDQLRLVQGEPPNAEIFACSGSPLSLSLRLDGPHDAVNGVQVLLEYDTSHLELVGITPGDGQGSPWDGATPIWLTDESGMVQYAQVLLGENVTVDATAATLLFNVLTATEYALPTTVRFSTECQDFQTKVTNVANATILPALVDSAPITIGPRIDVTVQVEGLTNAVTREVTFEVTTCGGLVQTITTPVSFDGSGYGYVAITGVDPAATWISAREGHTLRRRLPVVFHDGCIAAVSFNGDDRLIAGDLATPLTPQDNFIDILDYAILASRWNTMVSDCMTDLPAECRYGADVTGDGVQSTADFTAMQVNFFLVGDAADDCPVLTPPPTRPGMPNGVRMTRVDSEVVAPDASAVTGSGRGTMTGAELTRFGLSTMAADQDGNGVIDARDVRLFAQRQGLTLLPEFEGKLQRIESQAGTSAPPGP